uniref:NAD(P)H-quinone oxidoreductase subunit 2, chloroplastic n=1 Tax=Nitellopsis obtusa TaxID=40811 RepID=A0A8F6U484_9VIRI|nr:NADH-plastoquinone oxidoreductase subunit 2 [Nitellopsis obtusa]
MYFQYQFSSLNLSCFIPEGILIFNIILILIIDLVSKKENESILVKISFIGLLFSMLTLVEQWYHKSTIAFLGSFEVNHFTTCFRLIISLCCTLCIPLAFEYIVCSGIRFTEFIIFLLFTTLGAMILSSANDLITIFISLECLGLGSYLLTGYMKKDIRSNEAAMKYLIIGGTSSSIFAYGLSWLYGLSGGNIQLTNISHNFLHLDSSYNLANWFAYICIIVGIGFKLSLVPFHRWSPDVYEGSPTPVVAFLSIISKAAGLALIIRLSDIILPTLQKDSNLILQMLAILTMIIGNLLAMVETSMKRMLTYSSISQAGYLLIGIVVGKENGYASLLVYMIFYLFMNIGAFSCIILFGLRTGTDQIRDYTGLYKKDPLLASCLSLCLLSLAGIPPLTGFFGKIFLFWSAWQSGFYFLVITGIFTSIVSIYYYMRIIKFLVVVKEKNISYYVRKYCIRKYNNKTLFFQQNPIEFNIYLCTLISGFVGVFINPVIYFAQQSILK